MDQDYVNPPLRYQPMAQIADFEWTEDLLKFDAALVSHDWFYDYADDYGQWSAGRRCYKLLKRWEATSPAHAILYKWHFDRVHKRTNANIL